MNMNRSKKGIGMEKIKEIESRTQAQVIDLLKNAGLGKTRRRKMNDYGIAQRMCFEGLFINSRVYDTQIGWICQYLKI